MLINMLYIKHEGIHLPIVQFEKAVHQLQDSMDICQIESITLAFAVLV